MHSMHLSSIDLNLLLSLGALLESRSVTRAAAEVGLTQSAMSHALARLRLHFEDPLLVRSGQSMVMTPRAEALREPLRAALDSLGRVVAAPAPFEPSLASGLVSLTCGDYVSSLLVPRLLACFATEAPELDLDVAARPPAIAAALERGEVDVDIAVTFGAQGAIRRRRLFSESFVCVARRGNPRLGKRLTLKRYTECPHLLVGTSTRGRGAVDVALAKHGLERRVAARVATFLSAPLIVAETDHILTIPKRLARRFAEIYALDIFPPPIEIADFTFYCRWHERWQDDARHRWLRQLISKASDALGDES